MFALILNTVLEYFCLSMIHGYIAMNKSVFLNVFMLIVKKGKK